jgi:hypothetical protein
VGGHKRPINPIKEVEKWRVHRIKRFYFLGFIK